MTIVTYERNDLKPCKYCGKEPKFIIHINEYFNTAKICCLNEDDMCSIFSVVEVDEDLEKAFEKWNKGEY